MATPASGVEEELCERVARDIDQNLSILQRLGGDTADITSEMRQAALTQVDGRTSEALGILRSAQSRAARRSRELFERRVTDVERREAALRHEGVGVDLGDRLAKIKQALGANQRSDALALLSQADQRLSHVEGDWRGLKGLLDQIETLRTAHQTFESATPEVDESVAEVRAILSNPALDDAQLDEASKTAARALMLLHEGLPGRIEEELDRHASLLSVYPRDHAPTREAREMHHEAVRHLRRGRLAEATTALQQLRGAILNLRGVSAPRPGDAAGAEYATDGSEYGPSDRRSESERSSRDPQDALARLLKRARGLAARVRTLPPESEIAFEAAGEIRRATELLRAHNLEDAETTLTRLLRTLDAERTEAV
ncbi:MAG: hypothetical protein ACHQ2Y_09760 [Candidatus Lutacidiplasmatales archaeon]